MTCRFQEYFVEMPDGVKLYTWVVLPEKAGRYPTIVSRNPYVDAKADPAEYQEYDPMGYVRVFQHCRGCGASEGDCIPYINERNDGLALLEWIRKQDFYNGELFLFGQSYLASVHYSYLDTDPSDVKAAFLTVQDSERYNIIFRNGFLKTGLHGGWAVRMYRKNAGLVKSIVNESWQTRPLKGITPTLCGEWNQQLEDEMSHPDPRDAYWQTPAGGSDYSGAAARSHIPVHLATSWYDIYTEGVCDMWESLSPERKKDCTMVITPYSHSFNKADNALLKFPEATLSENLSAAPEINWFEHFRINRELEFVQRGRVLYYTMFENRWHSAEHLPCGQKKIEFFLTPERELVSGKPAVGSLTYRYNPYAPASFKGGVCNNFGGMQIQDPPNSRYDIISFLSGELPEMICNGQIELELEVSTTAPDSCFYARLDLVRTENGEEIAYSLRDDIDSVCRQYPEYLPGGKVVLKFRFAPHSFKISAGEKLRLDISSSCVPHFLVHPNRKGAMTEQTGADISDNTLHCCNSRLILFAD